MQEPRRQTDCCLQHHARGERAGSPPKRLSTNLQVTPTTHTQAMLRCLFIIVH